MSELVPPSTLPQSSALDLRDELQHMVCSDLVGPAGGEEEEVNEQYVSERYLCGILAPRYRKYFRAEAVEASPEALGGADTTKEEGPAEPQQPETDPQSMFPCTFGFTCTLPHDATELRISASWGAYRRQYSDTIQRQNGEPQMVWKRAAMAGSHAIKLREGKLELWQPEPHLAPDVRVEGQARKRDWGWLVSLFLVNGAHEPKESADSSWLFQAKLRAESPGKEPIFEQHQMSLEGDKHDEPAWFERRQLAMMHRHCVEFASGHNVSVHVEREPSNPRRARAIETTALPTQTVERQDPPAIQDVEGLDGLNLSMQALADLPDCEVIAALRPLETAYRSWIDKRRAEMLSDDTLKYLQEVAESTLSSCELAQERIKAGIDLLERDQSAMRAFRFANRAMALQRVHSLWIEARRTDERAALSTYDVVKNRSWRPFQLAFILLNLPALSDPRHHDRSEDVDAPADLLWFPTGGGKTEAYLGLTAFTLAMRRLQGTVGGRDGAHGIAVLMRYTLRLLTLQQFQRAAALICACEVERRLNARLWGDEPFRLGLWVGAKTTPNSTKSSAEAVKNLRQSSYGGGGATPAQFTNCPWCGAAFDASKHIHVDEDRGRTLLFCPNFAGQCPFTEKNSRGEGIPALVVDEEIYRLLPSLLIATVDKFAQMPWNGRTAMLFGQVNGRCPRHGFTSPSIEDGDHAAKGNLPATRLASHGPLRPPDLIIQDELHLISGPLGTLVGLYETAVDALCSWKLDGQTVRPKVVASTATIRNARRQMKALFLRSVEVFPPPGLDSRDNFFSQQTPSTDKAPARLYVGVCAPGKRLKSALIRVYVAYMGAAQSLYRKYGALADPYLTTIGYFNSMRELGGMRRLIDDDVSSRLKRIERRGLDRRENLKIEELTSRKSGTDIPVMLDRLNATFDPVAADGRKKAYKEKRTPKTSEPLDVCLATNMISVGVDVPRLGLMIVAGQPKSTSEYIQATSRVGRQKPGVVCTVFNWARPRDLSHYERFEHYHSTFYQHVEALSVTPFAPRALDRGLSALLVSLVRLEGDAYNANARAADVQPQDSLVQDAMATIAKRAGDVEQSNEVAQEVAQVLKARLDEWHARILAQAKTGVPLGYDSSRQGVSGLLKKPDGGAWETFTCLNSLRDVEPLCNLMLSDVGMDDEPRPSGPQVLAGHGEQL